MKNKAIIIGSLVVVGVGIYFLLKPKKEVSTSVKEEETAPEETASDVVEPKKPASVSTGGINTKKVLSLGSKGEEVKILQKKLGGLIADGDFGNKTQQKLVDTFSLTKITLAQLDSMLPKVPYVKIIFPTLKGVYSRTGLYGLDTAYLKDWSSAITKKQPFFSHKDKTYSTSTGRAESSVSTLGGMVIFK